MKCIISQQKQETPRYMSCHLYFVQSCMHKNAKKPFILYTDMQTTTCCLMRTMHDVASFRVLRGALRDTWQAHQ